MNSPVTLNEDNFYLQLYDTLLAQTPIATGNLISHLKLENFGTFYRLTVTALPTRDGGTYDYAEAVNYGLVAKYYGRGMTPKEAKNFQFVERSIEQACELLNYTLTYI